MGTNTLHFWTLNDLRQLIVAAEAAGVDHNMPIIVGAWETEIHLGCPLGVTSVELKPSSLVLGLGCQYCQEFASDQDRARRIMVETHCPLNFKKET